MAKRGRKPGKERKGYFYEKEEQAVIDYISTNDGPTKEKIYNEILRPAFEKMVSSIIRRYRLYIPDEEYEQTYNDALSELITKMNYYNPSKKTKAYSYYGTIVKNYLMNRGCDYQKELQKNLPFEETADEISEENNYTPYEQTFEDEAINLVNGISLRIKEMINEKDKYGLNQNEIKVGLALSDLFDNWENLLPENGSNKLNKSSILFFLREETKMSTKEVRDNMKKYKKAYKALRHFIFE